MDTLLNEQWQAIRQAALKGHQDAQWELGYYYHYGAVDAAGKSLVKANSVRALKWYLLSAEQGNVDAQCSLSNLMSSGEGIQRDAVAAMIWAKKAVAQGSSAAAFNLGTIYRDLRRYRLAFQWYKRAAAMGDLDAYIEIGLSQALGIGTRRDVVAAMASFQKVLNGDKAASSQRSKENAQFWLALFMLSSGQISSRSLSKARRLLEGANTDDDHEQANSLLHVLGKTRCKL